MKEFYKTPVVIVGAGPTGLMAANQLARFGIEFIILDKKEGPTRESRAIAVTARSLEIYEQMGIVETALNQGKFITSFNLYSAGKPKVEVKIGEIGKGLSAYSYMLAFEQSKNETLLSEHLTTKGIKIWWGCEYDSLMEYQDKVKLVVNDGHGSIQIESQYLIACDGASSPVRQALNFNFSGGTYDQLFFVADVELQWALDYQRLIVTPGNENFCAFLPMYGERNYRVLGTLPKNFSKNESINFSQIQGVIANTLGIPVEFHLVNWFSTYKLHHRMADSFRKGCVFLAGDSAHIHSPAGGQGMNTGLQDAYNLAWKLSMVIKKQATEKLLDTYNEERLPFARWLLKFTDRGFKVMTNNSNWLLKFFRQNIAVNIAGLVLSSGFIRPLAFKIISQIGYSYKRRSLSASKSRQKLKFSAGDRLPYFTDDNIYGKFTRPGFHLLHIHDHPLTGDEVNSINKLYNFPVFIVEDIESTKWQKLGLKRELFVLVRPDNYISYICDHLDQLASDPARQLFSN